MGIEYGTFGGECHALDDLSGDHTTCPGRIPFYYQLDRPLPLEQCSSRLCTTEAPVEPDQLPLALLYCLGLSAWNTCVNGWRIRYDEHLLWHFLYCLMVDTLLLWPIGAAAARI